MIRTLKRIEAPKAKPGIACPVKVRRIRVKIAPAATALFEPQKSVKEIFLNSSHPGASSVFEIIRCELLQQRHSTVDSVSPDSDPLAVIEKPLHVFLRHRIHGLQARAGIHLGHWMHAAIETQQELLRRALNANRRPAHGDPDPEASGAGANVAV
ncbi:hypothetical protein EKK58_12200 [Candidatus Dependentiae bacterium]|nr:MAG: hypothetical protein EKK58_12200 [Candidatus Dependentiae bacterium]